MDYEELTARLANHVGPGLGAGSPDGAQRNPGTPYPPRDCPGFRCAPSGLRL